MPDLEKQRVGFVRRFVSGMRFPYAFLAMAAVFLADLAIPDVIPFLDEIGLGLLTALLAGAYAGLGQNITRPLFDTLGPLSALAAAIFLRDLLGAATDRS